MKKTFNKILLLLAFSAVIHLQSCVDATDLATPNVASPVLVLLQGTAFAPNATVAVGSKFFELDKSNILNNAIGIDSIPVSNLAVKVFINNTTEIGSLVTDALGAATLAVSWQALGLTEAKPGNQVRLEFAGTHKNVAFRKYHTVRVQ